MKLSIARYCIGAILSLFIAIPLVLALIGCDTVKDRATAGVGALVDCEAPSLKAAVAELVPIAKLAILKLIGGDGKVDTEKLRAACAALVSNLPRCAMAGAIAALTVTAPPAGLTVIAQPLAVPDPGALRLAFESVRADWGGASYRTASGTL